MQYVRIDFHYRLSIPTSCKLRRLPYTRLMPTPPVTVHVHNPAAEDGYGWVEVKEEVQECHCLDDCHC